VHLPGGEADLKFFEIVIEQENKTSQPLPVDTLIALRALRDRRQLDTGELAKLIQKDEVSARQVLERMIEAGLVEARGAARGRTYLLSSSIYRKLGESAAYIRIRGFDRIQQEQMIKDYVRKHGNITRREAAELCRLNLNQASYLLKKLSESDLLLPVGKGRNAHYVLNKMSENSHS
jgi:ATP-dependent DNA helicase RecG